MSGKNIAKNKNGRFLRRRTCPFCFYFVITTKQTKTKRYGQKYIFLPDSRSSRNSARTSTGTKSSKSAWNLAENVTGSIWRVDASANGLVPNRSTLGDANAKRRESIFGNNNFMLKPANLDDCDIRLSQGRHDAQGENLFVCWNQDIRKGMQGAGSPALDEQPRPRSRSKSG